MLQLQKVELEKIYPHKDREKDIGKMKTYFEMRMNPMQRLASQPNGARLIKTFILDPESIHQHQKYRKYFENPVLHQVFEDIRHNDVQTPFDSLITSPKEQVAHSIERPKTCDPVANQLVDEQLVSKKYFYQKVRQRFALTPSLIEDRAVVQQREDRLKEIFGRDHDRKSALL